MNVYTESLSRLIESFARLPGIGERSARRIAFHVLNMPKEETEAFARTILDSKEKIKYCSICCNFTDTDPCKVCSSGKRDKRQIMVVEDAKDMAAYENTRAYNGTYHILHGAISPMSGVSPADLKIKELLQRLQKDDVAEEAITEVIIATSPTIEGEATAMYLSEMLKSAGVKVSRIASGVPVGGNIEYMDGATLGLAFKGRREM